MGRNSSQINITTRALPDGNGNVFKITGAYEVKTESRSRIESGGQMLRSHDFQVAIPIGFILHCSGNTAWNFEKC
jgi:hypothetical protein